MKTQALQTWAADLMDEREALTWVFYGDSITHGSKHLFGYRDYSELFAERVRWELGRHHDMVINSAVGGYTSSNLLQHFDRHVSAFSPDAVLIMVGMNDCHPDKGVLLDLYRENVAQLILACRRISATPVLQTSSPVLAGSDQVRELHFDAYMEALRSVACAADAFLVDHLAHWRTHSAWEKDYWMANGIHPNEYGHRRLAVHLLDGLGIFDPESVTCRLFTS